MRIYGDDIVAALAIAGTFIMAVLGLVGLLLFYLAPVALVCYTAYKIAEMLH